MFRVSRKLGVHICDSHLWCQVLGSRLEKCCNLSLLRNQELLHNLQHLVKLYPQGKCTCSASSQQGTGSSESNLSFTERVWLIGVCYTSKVKRIKKNLSGATTNSSKPTSSLCILTAPLQSQDLFAVLILKAVLHRILQSHESLSLLPAER